MVKESTPPHTIATLNTKSSPLTPAAKRVRMSSASSHQAATAAETTPSQPQNAGTNELQTELSTSDGDLEVVGISATIALSPSLMASCEQKLTSVIQDDTYTDSGFGTDNTDTTSVASSIYAGFMENGRRYQTVREGDYWGPSDEKQVCSFTTTNHHARAPLIRTRSSNPCMLATLCTPSSIRGSRTLCSSHQLARPLRTSSISVLALEFGLLTWPINFLRLLSPEWTCILHLRLGYRRTAGWK